MPKTVDKNTGEVIQVIHTWRNPKPIVAQKFDKNIIQHYDFAYDPDIRGLKIVEASKEDREAYIQSFASETGVYNILKKYSKTGDISLLNAREGFYADVSNIPSDELDPVKVAAEASKAVAGLNKALGVDLSADELAKMSAEQLNDLINKAVAAAAQKAAPVEKKEGE